MCKLCRNQFTISHYSLKIQYELDLLKDYDLRLCIKRFDFQCSHQTPSCPHVALIFKLASAVVTVTYHVLKIKSPHLVAEKSTEKPSKLSTSS